VGDDAAGRWKLAGGDGGLAMGMGFAIAGKQEQLLTASIAEIAHSLRKRRRRRSWRWRWRLYYFSLSCVATSAIAGTHSAELTETQSLRSYGDLSDGD
jgi:hypothetical protein